MRTWSKPNLIIENWFWVQWCAPAKIQIFLSFFLLIEFCQIKQKVKNGSCSRHSCVNQDDLNECMIYHMKVHIFSYNLGPKNFSKSRICILPNYEQTDSKTAIVVCRNSIDCNSSLAACQNRYPDSAQGCAQSRPQIPN